VEWPTIFRLVQQPAELWVTWGPSKTLNSYSLPELWDVWTVGEAVLNKDGEQTGKKPPLRLVEQHFKATWRVPKDKTVCYLFIVSTTADRKQERSRIAQAWGRFREIPEWIDKQTADRGISPADAMRELEGMTSSGLNSLSKKVKQLRESVTTVTVHPIPDSETLDSTLPLPDAVNPSSHQPETPLVDPQLQAGVKRQRAKPKDSRRRKKAKVEEST
jgi:hypothetical protein